jgi:hypothetical protein
MRFDRKDVRLPGPESMAMQVAAGRAVFAAAFLAAPVGSLRLIGADTATARRVSWLSRMMAGRDGVLSVGALVATRSGGGSAGAWILAGAVADAVDAVAMATALKQGRVKGIVPTLVVPGAAAAAALGAVTALRLRRR